MDPGFGGMGLFIGGMVCFSLAIGLAVPAGLFAFIAKKKKERSALLAAGVPGQATIVQMGDTGMRINNQPRLSLMLDVQPVVHPGMPPSFAPFRGQHDCVVPMMAMSRVGPGMVVPVKVDPQDPARLTIDWSAMGFMV